MRPNPSDRRQNIRMRPQNQRFRFWCWSQETTKLLTSEHFSIPPGRLGVCAGRGRRAASSGAKSCPGLNLKGRQPGRISCGRPVDPRLCAGTSAAASGPALIRSGRFHSDLFFRGRRLPASRGPIPGEGGRITSSSRSSLTARGGRVEREPSDTWSLIWPKSQQRT